MSRAERPGADRHLFASSTSPYNAAWETCGRSAGLDRVRARRLEERVPWAAGLADLEDPPVLIDEDGGRTATAVGFLPEAFLPLDNRLGFCLSGVIRAKEGRTSRRWRTATHTLLFDEGLFRQMDGFPQGLHLDLPGPGGGGAPVDRAPWFEHFGRSAPSEPTLLPEIGSVPPRSCFRSARLREVARLAGVICDWLGNESAARQCLAETYLTLYRALRAGSCCAIEWSSEVAGREGSGRGTGPLGLVVAAPVRPLRHLLCNHMAVETNAGSLSGGCRGADAEQLASLASQGYAGTGRINRGRRRRTASRGAGGVGESGY